MRGCGGKGAVGEEGTRLGIGSASKPGKKRFAGEEGLALCILAVVGQWGRERTMRSKGQFLEVVLGRRTLPQAPDGGGQTMRNNGGGHRLDYAK